MRIILAFSLILTGIIAWISTPESSNDLDAKINGVSLVSPPREIQPDKINEVKRINAAWVAIIPYGFSRAGQPSVSYDHPRQWWGERTEGTTELIRYAHQHELKVMLKPHVWVIGEGWTGDFNVISEDEWVIWEHDYRAYLLHYARLAEERKVELFCIGTEYRIPARERPAYWRGLIKEVRQIYSGEITYASNWDNFMNINWWDEVDYIGIDSYFPLCDGQDPPLESMKKGWEPLKRELENFSHKWRKPILFTEYGFQSVNGGAGKHWEVDKSEENANMEVQSKAYRATFEAVWNERWFAGGFLWKWHLTTRGAERNKTRFTPQGKPAEKIIAKWYESN